MKLIIDMNLSPRWAGHLRTNGFEAVHWSELGPASAPDRSIMAYAREHDLVILTHDLDFGAILAASGGDKPSVVQIRANDTSPEKIGSQVVAALSGAKADLDTGALLTIDVGRNRLRLLPLIRKHN